jgi:PEGA domain
LRAHQNNNNAAFSRVACDPYFSRERKYGSQAIRLNAGTVLIAVLLLMATGCVQRVLTVNTNPPGALVYLNQQEIGRTPCSKDFLWYGDYDVAVRMDGYETLKTDAAVASPWWQWIPLDLVTDILPLKDEHVLHYTLKPIPDENANDLLHRGQQMAWMLEGSENTKVRPPSTKPTSRPTTKPATRPTSHPK